MKVDVTLWKLLGGDPILGQRGRSDLKDVVSLVQDLCDCDYSDAVDKKLDEFIENVYEDDGESFIQAVLYDHQTLEEELRNYFGDESNESYHRRVESGRRTRRILSRH